MNYLTLVNETIREAGVTLEELTSSNFSSTTDRQQIRFKNWVARAWREIQLERGEWQWMVTNKVTNLYPRIYVENGNRATAPAAGHVYTTQETEVALTVVATTTLSGAWASGTAVAYIDLETRGDTLKFNENADETSPTPANLDVFTIKAKGLYDLETVLGSGTEILPEELYVQDTGNSSVQDNDGSVGWQKVTFVDWDKWNDHYGVAPAFGQPIYFTKALDGKYDFWPALDKEYTFKATLRSAATALSAYTSEPTVPEQFQWAIIWRAYMFWAQFEERPADVATGFRNYMFYKKQLDRYTKPRFTWGRSKYDE